MRPTELSSRLIGRTDRRALERYVIYLLTVAAVVLGALVLVPATARADEAGGLEIDVAGDTAAMGETPDGPVLSGDLLAPGDSTSGQLSVRSDQAGSLGIRVVDLRSDDNGCIEPETAAGDTSCGDGEGEMADAVLVTVTRSGELLWSGSPAQLETDGIPPLVLAAGVVQILDWEATVLPETGNEAQSDSVAFALQLVLDGPEVAGVVIERVDGFGTLPKTGAPIDLLVLVGVLLLLGGAAAVRLRRRSLALTGT
jgi:LPXTG-motif cell wall-anchored protein